MKLVRRYIERPHLILSFVILLSVVGIIGYKRIPFNLFPDTDPPPDQRHHLHARRCGSGREDRYNADH
jgi:hypothetical protein